MRMNIEAERGRQGLTKTQVAERLGVTLTTYNTYINGASIPSDKLIALSDMFGVSCDYLLGRTQPRDGCCQINQEQAG